MSGAMRWALISLATCACLISGANASTYVQIGTPLEYVVPPGHPPTGVYDPNVPTGYSEWGYTYDSPNVVGGQNPINLRNVLSSADWFNVPLTFVAQATCDFTGVCPSDWNTSGYLGKDPGNGSLTLGPGIGANVFGIRFDAKYIAVMYSTAISAFFIDGLSNPITHITAFCSLANCAVSDVPPVATTPLPAALVPFGTVLGGAFLAWAWRRRRAQ